MILRYGKTSVSSIPYLTSRVYHLHAYPNPSTGRLFVEIILSENSKIDISILDIKGRTVLSLPAMALEAGTHTIGLDMTGLAQGQYILEAVGNEGVGRERIVYLK